MDCAGLGIEAAEIDELVKMTGPHGPHDLTYTFSDIRTRLLPEALGLAYPTRKISYKDLVEAVSKVKPSPAIQATDTSK